ncbi:hypothetical protein ACW9HC_28590 [Nocardia gipuzkoensis]
MNSSRQVRISVLDTAPIPQGSNARMALRNSVELAQFVDELGYYRYWVPSITGCQGWPVQHQQLLPNAWPR